MEKYVHIPACHYHVRQYSRLYHVRCISGHVQKVTYTEPGGMVARICEQELFFSSHWEVGSSMNCFVTEGGGGGRSGSGAGEFTFFAITWIRLIGSRQNLAWTYYLTLGTSLRKNFSFFSKSKMAAGGQKFATRYTFSMFLQ